MATQINFTEEASKVAAVFAAFQAEIKRLTIENQELQAQLAKTKISQMIDYSSQSWMVPPAEQVINPIPVQEPIHAEPEQDQAIKHKRRGPNKPAEAGSRCHALLPSIEMTEDGQLKPSQCKRSSEENCGFCKQHADHQNYGTVDQPNDELFSKNREHLMKAFNKKNGIVETKKQKKPKSAIKRALNPYMMFLAVNRDRVKEELMAENPELKGRALAMAITSSVGRLWQAAKGCDMGDVSDSSSECTDCSRSEAEIEAELDELLGVN